MADDPSDAEKDGSPTERDLEGPGVSGDTLREVAGHYVAPRKLPEATRHRTIDLSPVRLSADADPRRASTERRLPNPAARRKARALSLALVLGASALAAVAWAVWSRSVEPASEADVAKKPAAVPDPAPGVAAPAPRPSTTNATSGTSSLPNPQPGPTTTASATSEALVGAKSSRAPDARPDGRLTRSPDGAASDRTESKAPDPAPRPTATPSRSEPGSKKRQVWVE